MMRKKVRKTVISITSVLVVLVAAFLIYVEIYYKAKDVDSYMDSSDTVTVTLDNDKISFIGGTSDLYDTIILYPGAKVEAKAYAPLARSLAEGGNHVYIVRMPFRLAFFGANAAKKIRKYDMETYQTGLSTYLTDYYLMGHSLGGVMASSFISKHTEEYKGIILLASWSTKDLSDSGLDVLSIYGSEDGVLNKKSYEKAKSNLPSDASELVIDGGCHAYFASYGAQKGDGTPTIERSSQILQTVIAVEAFIKL